MQGREPPDQTTRPDRPPVDQATTTGKKTTSPDYIYKTATTQEYIELMHGATRAGATRPDEKRELPDQTRIGSYQTRLEKGANRADLEKANIYKTPMM